jgi:hypothetical protein
MSAALGASRGASIVSRGSGGSGRAAARTPIPVIAARVLFAATAVLWMLIAVLVTLGLISLGPVDAAARVVLVGLMVAAAGAFALLAARAFAGERWVDRAALVVAVANVVATLADQVGAWDVPYLFLASKLLIAVVWSLVITGRTADAGAGSLG